MLKITPTLAACLVANTAFAQTCQTTQAQALSAASATTSCASMPYVTMQGSAIVDATTGVPISLASYTPVQVAALTGCAQSTAALQSIADPKAAPSAAGVGAPAPAAAVGYNTLTFGPAIENWIKDTQNGTTANATQNADGSVTIAGGGDTWNGQLETYAGGRGVAFGGGFYAQATASVPGATSCLGSFDNCGSTDSEWPSFWSNSVNGSIEVDFMEMMSPVAGQYGATVHNWSTSPPTVNGQTVSAPAGNTLHGPNTYGFLWIPATASSQGSMSFFFNGNQVGQSITWTQANPGPYGVIDGQKLVLYLGAGPNSPMVVSSVEVWQASTAGNSMNGGPAPAMVTAIPTAGGQATCAAANPVTPTTPPTQATANPPTTATPDQSMTDANGNTWAVTADGTITENGKSAAYSADVAKVVTVNGTTYQQTTFGGWWGWDGSGWVGVSGDPTQGPVTVTTVADDKGQNYAVSSGAALANDKLSAPVTLLHVSDAEALTTAQAAALEGQ